MKTRDLSETRKLQLANMASTLHRHQKIAAFTITLLLMFAAQFSLKTTKFIGDANAYWHYSSFIFNMDFPQVMRGYSYPLFLAFPRWLYDSYPVLGFAPLYILQATIFAFSLSILLPYVFTNLIGGQVSLIRRIIPASLVALFYPGLIAYPLSDLPSFCMILASLALIISGSRQEDLHRSIFAFFFAGIAAYSAYNTRTIYIFTILLLIPIIPLIALKNQTTLSKTVLFITFFLGVSAASIPQALINLKHLGIPNPLVVTNFKNTSLYASQLKWGVTIQRFEGKYNPETGSLYPVYYLDPAGEKTFKDHSMGVGPVTIPWFMKILASDPIPFLKIYIRHFINGMDIRDAEIYTTTPSKDRKMRSIASVSISIFGLFCTGWLLMRRDSQCLRRKKYIHAAWTFLLIFPVLAITPSAIETRFYLPLHIIAWCSISFGLSSPAIKATSRKLLLLLGIIYMMAVSLAYISAENSVQKSTQDIPTEYFD